MDSFGGEKRQINELVKFWILCWKLRWIFFFNYFFEVWVSLVAQIVKNLPAMQETQVQSLGWEDPLEKKLATHSNSLAWRSPWTEEPGRL